jgi:UDP-N-acetyl-D-mannosaminuronic acid dehydrogenase
MLLVELARGINDGQVHRAVRMLRDELGGLDGVPVLVLGLTYREGVKELAYTRAIPLIERLASEGARVSAWDPLLTDDEVRRCGAAPWSWGSTSNARVIVTQTADPAFLRLEVSWFPDLELVLDGRNSLRDVAFPGTVRVLGIGVPARGQRVARTRATA